MMERLLKNNTVVKIIAFFLALILWIYVSGENNVTKVARETYRNVPLAWINLDEQLEVMQIPAEVDVVLSGRAEVLEDITPQNLKAFVDLRGLDQGQHRLSPSAEVPRGVRVISFTPQQVVVELEEVESPQMPVTLDILGNPAEGYVMGEPRILPNSVFVRGPRSLLNKIDRIRAIVNIAGANSDRIQMVPVQAVDNNGQVVDGLRINPGMVEVLLPFSEPQKTVPIRVPLQGEPANGYKVQQVNLEPATVTIQGTEANLENITEILTTPVNVAGATASISTELSLVRPENAILLLTGKVQADIVIVPE